MVESENQYFDDPIEDSQSPVKKRFSFILAFLSLVFGGTYLVQITLAANISLNSGSPVEFGQGITQLVACDDEVKITPTSSFVNADGGGGFKFTSITLSELDGSFYVSSSDKGCAGKTLTIKSYDSSGNLLAPYYVISLADDGSFSSLSGTTDGNATEGDTDSSVKLTFVGTLINADSVHRITIESSSVINMAFLTTTAIDITSELTSDSIEYSLPYEFTSIPVARIFIYPGSGTIIATVVGSGVLGTSNLNGSARALVLSRDPNSATNLYFFADGTYGTSTISITVSGQQNIKTVNFGHSSNGF
jgi:hypothetical protein